ncbi:MAG: VWA domain-containing protein [Planctomycetes bacterium]|nr:VWA domain-containing protein [Planctomycetota bacterium]
MDFTSEGENRMTYGASLAAALTLLMLRQGDQVGLGVFDKEVRNFIPPRGNARHFGAIVDALEHIQPGEDTNISGVLHQMAERVRRRSMVIIISDFFDDVEPILNSLQHFRHRHNEVIVLHLLDEIELTFPFDRVTLFEGMKRGEEVVIDPRIMAESYRRSFHAHMEGPRRGCTGKNVDYQRMMLSEPFDRALSSYLGKRA